MALRDRISEGLDYLAGVVEEHTGRAVVDADRLSMLEASAQELAATRRDLDMLGWTVLDYMSGTPHEVKIEQRRKWARNSRIAWMHDPMAGSAVDLMNDFVFGKGVPRPRAKMDEVQQIIDDAWDDPDNQAVLTTYSAQVALGTDLQLQSNLFVLIFDDGEDGRVKLGMLDHDSVTDVVRDPENRLRVLYYLATKRETKWNFATDSLETVEPGKITKPLYYEHWRNVRDAEQEIEDGKRDAGSVPKPPSERMGKGRVYHISVNRTSEMVFGVPSMQRVLRWFSAYNDFMAARVDMAKAAAALVMKRKVKGGDTQLSRMAARAISRGGEIGTGPGASMGIGPGPAGIIEENENVTHEGFKLDSGSANAQADGTMLRSQVSAGTRLPQHYLGDQGNANLATATAMELPVTKMVDARQELFEQLFRAFIDMVIERAVEKGTLKVAVGKGGEIDLDAANELKTTVEASASPDTPSASASTDVQSERGASKPNRKGNAKDRGPTPKKVDLTYEFKMPSAIKRLMGDLTLALQTIAKTFDPNGTNMELNRTLLTIALGDALEMQDPAEAVARIFPAGYEDPLVKQQLEMGQAPPGGAGAPPPGGGGGPPPATAGEQGMTLEDLLKGGGGKKGGTPAVGGQPGSGRAGPYGTKSGKPQEAAEDEDALRDAIAEILETRYKDLPAAVRKAAEERLAASEDDFDEVVGSVARELVHDLPVTAATNGHVPGQ